MSDIHVFGVLGAGQMGSGIAQVAASAGWTVKLADATLERATAARDRIAAGLKKLAEKGKLSADEAAAVAGRIVPVDGIAGLADADFVVEAVTEHLETKLALFAQLDAAVKPGAVLASNTSSISITRIAAATKRPADVVGLHFFNPVPLMKLVEVIRALQTSDETNQRAVDAVAKLNKAGVAGMAAATAHDHDKTNDAGSAMYDACFQCHGRYIPRPKDSLYKHNIDQDLADAEKAKAAQKAAAPKK